MANKKISQLDPSLKNLRDADYLECEPHDGTKSYRYTLEQVRAVEKAEREATDDAIIGAVGLDTDGSLIPFSGSNYVDDATDIANAISLLDASIAANIPSAVSVANVGDGAGEVYKETVAGTIYLKTIKAGTNITVTNNTNDVTIESNELASLIDSKGEMIVGDASGGASPLNPINDGSSHILVEKDANVSWKDNSDTVALAVNDSSAAASVDDDHIFSVTKTGAGLSKVTFAELKASIGSQVGERTTALETADYDIPELQKFNVINTSAGNVQATLPIIATAGNKDYIIRNTDNGGSTGYATTIFRASTDTIYFDGSSYQGLTTTVDGAWVHLASEPDSDVWYVVAGGENFTGIV